MHFSSVVIRVSIETRKPNVEFLTKDLVKYDLISALHYTYFLLIAQCMIADDITLYLNVLIAYFINFIGSIQIQLC